ncbi:unnamed protein product [Paramecium primaurelia]|uniref:Uncharacterized protein n=1 Tax=Paramecium primaurelia TaxID=5886 RepID=A0A8S1JLW5_PARPR|nr:unnamed protein product [Paramecium primaurelia]
MNFDAQTMLATQIGKKRIIELNIYEENSITVLNYKKTLALRIIELQRSIHKDFGNSDQKF